MKDKDKRIAFSLRLPQDLNEAISELAWQARKSKTELIADVLMAYWLKKRSKK